MSQYVTMSVWRSFTFELLRVREKQSTNLCMTSLYISKQINVMTYDLPGQGGQNMNKADNSAIGAEQKDDGCLSILDYKILIRVWN